MYPAWGSRIARFPSPSKQLRQCGSVFLIVSCLVTAATAARADELREELNHGAMCVAVFQTLKIRREDAGDLTGSQMAAKKSMRIGLAAGMRAGAVGARNTPDEVAFYKNRFYTHARKFHTLSPQKLKDIAQYCEYTYLQ